METPATSEQVKRAKLAFRLTVASSGYLQDQESIKKELRLFVRDKVFQRVKFARHELMVREGNIYKSVKGHLGFDIEQHDTSQMTAAVKAAKKEDYDKKFEALWNRWILKETKNTITKKRNSITQRLQRDVVRGKVQV